MHTEVPSIGLHGMGEAREKVPEIGQALDSASAAPATDRASHRSASTGFLVNWLLVVAAPLRKVMSQHWNKLYQLQPLEELITGLWRIFLHHQASLLCLFSTPSFFSLCHISFFLNHIQSIPQSPGPRSLPYILQCNMGFSKSLEHIQAGKVTLDLVHTVRGMVQ